MEKLLSAPELTPNTLNRMRDNVKEKLMLVGREGPPSPTRSLPPLTSQTSRGEVRRGQMVAPASSNHVAPLTTPITLLPLRQRSRSASRPAISDEPDCAKPSLKVRKELCVHMFII